MFLKHDPGPCPVDDSPHTTCCPSESEAVVVTEARPPRDGPRQPRSAPRIVVRALGETEFTTATYRKEKHDPRRARAVKDKS